MLFPVRCQVHAELAVTEEGDGLLEASMAHLQKAMLLDNGTQKERLSSAFHLLQLRRNLYQTPSRSEDKAAMLMQQVCSTLCHTSEQFWKLHKVEFWKERVLVTFMKMRWRRVQ